MFFVLFIITPSKENFLYKFGIARPDLPWSMKMQKLRSVTLLMSGKMSDNERVAMHVITCQNKND